MRLAILACLLLTVSKVSAHTPVDGDIYATGGLFNYATHPLHHKFATPVLQGPALKAEADINKHGGVEVSLFYLQNSFAIREDSRLLIERVKRLYIASGYRHWFTDKFSMALAFSSSYAIGDAVTQVNEFGGAAHPDTSAEDTTEYGFDLSVQYEFWRHERFSAVIDGRYDWSVTGKPGEDSNHYGVMVGLKYFLQSRQRSPDDI